MRQPNPTTCARSVATTSICKKCHIVARVILRRVLVAVENGCLKARHPSTSCATVTIARLSQRDTTASSWTARTSRRPTGYISSRVNRRLLPTVARSRHCIRHSQNSLASGFFCAETATPGSSLRRSCAFYTQRLCLCQLTILLGHGYQRQSKGACTWNLFCAACGAVCKLRRVCVNYVACSVYASPAPYLST
jgi:hypothetical protein